MTASLVAQHHLQSTLWSMSRPGLINLQFPAWVNRIDLHSKLQAAEGWGGCHLQVEGCVQADRVMRRQCRQIWQKLDSSIVAGLVAALVPARMLGRISNASALPPCEGPPVALSAQPVRR